MCFNNGSGRAHLGSHRVDETVQTGAQIEIRGGINRPPFERTPAVVALLTAHDRIASQRAILAKDQRWRSDGNFTAAQGFPLVAWVSKATGPTPHTNTSSSLTCRAARRSSPPCSQHR
jgi:glutamate carboxypeptidase